MGLFYQYWTQRKQIQESEYFTQELSLVITYSSRFVQYPHCPIACCLPHRTSTVAHNCHGKSTLTSQQKERLTVFFFLPWGYSFCGEVILFAVRLFFLRWGYSFCRDVILFAVRFFFLPWGFSFCREVFLFAVRFFFSVCHEVILFAVRFFFLPWGYSFCREVNSFAVTVVGHRTTYLWNSVPEDSWFFNMWVFRREN